MEFPAVTPGLVGGHCIGVDPYYLTHRAEKAGYHPEIILAGRRINGAVDRRVAAECIKALYRKGWHRRDATVMGMAFKENVPDIRNSRTIDIVSELESGGVAVQVTDALALADEVRHEYGIELTPLESLKPADAVIVTAAHDVYVQQDWGLVQRLLKGGRGVVLDVRARSLPKASKPGGIELWRM